MSKPNRPNLELSYQASPADTRIPLFSKGVRALLTGCVRSTTGAPSKASLAHHPPQESPPPLELNPNAGHNPATSAESLNKDLACRRALPRGGLTPWSRDSRNRTKRGNRRSHCTLLRPGTKKESRVYTRTTLLASKHLKSKRPRRQYIGKTNRPPHVNATICYKKHFVLPATK
eukprot:2183183-Amphidinium_carterae.1